MAGISSRAAYTLENKKQKFQGQELASKEFSDGTILEMYEFKWRMDDPQTGRFWQIDPLADKYVYNSTYAFSENKVTSHVELEGLEALKFQDLWRFAGVTKNSGEQINNKVIKAIEKGGKISKDIIIVGGGITILIASSGTAAPLFAIATGGISVAGGTAKLILDAQGKYDESDEVPTTISGTAIFTINQITSDKNGKKSISHELQATIEFIEGTLTFNPKDFNKVNGALKQSNATLTGISLIMDGSELPEKIKQLLLNFSLGSVNGNTPNSNKPVSDHIEDNKAKKSQEHYEFLLKTRTERNSILRNF